MKWMLLPLYVGLTAAFVQPVCGFLTNGLRAPFRTTASTTHLLQAVRHVQVCGFKDCRRVGGGKKLESLVQQVLQENNNNNPADNNDEPIEVEICDCLGECGYGPNLVVDGQIVNGVRGRQAVLQALGMAVESQQQEVA